MARMSDDKKDRGLEKGLTSYGDRDFSLFLRKAFIKGAGYTDDALSRPERCRSTFPPSRSGRSFLAPRVSNTGT